MSLFELKLRIDASQYVVDPAVVAEAVLQRDGLYLIDCPVRPAGARSPSTDGDRAHHAS